MATKAEKKSKSSYLGSGFYGSAGTKGPVGFASLPTEDPVVHNAVPQLRQGAPMGGPGQMSSPNPAAPASGPAAGSTSGGGGFGGINEPSGRGTVPPLSAGEAPQGAQPTSLSPGAFAGPMIEAAGHALPKGQSVSENLYGQEGRPEGYLDKGSLLTQLSNAINPQMNVDNPLPGWLPGFGKEDMPTVNPGTGIGMGLSAIPVVGQGLGLLNSVGGGILSAGRKFAKDLRLGKREEFMKENPAPAPTDQSGDQPSFASAAPGSFTPGEEQAPTPPSKMYGANDVNKSPLEYGKDAADYVLNPSPGMTEAVSARGANPMDPGLAAEEHRQFSQQMVDRLGPVGAVGTILGAPAYGLAKTAGQAVGAFSDRTPSGFSQISAGMEPGLKYLGGSQNPTGNLGTLTNYGEEPAGGFLSKNQGSSSERLREGAASPGALPYGAKPWEVTPEDIPSSGAGDTFNTGAKSSASAISDSPSAFEGSTASKSLTSLGDITNSANKAAQLLNQQAGKSSPYDYIYSYGGSLPELNKQVLQNTTNLASASQQPAFNINNQNGGGPIPLAPTTPAPAVPTFQFNPAGGYGGFGSMGMKQGGLVDKTKLGLDPEAYFPHVIQPVGEATGALSMGLPPGEDPFIQPSDPGGGWDTGGGGGGGDGGGGDGGGGSGGGDGGGGDGGGFRQGGFVSQGDPQSTQDDVPAMLQQGEYVVPRPAMKQLAEKTGGYQQAAQKVRELILKFANDGKSSIHFKERG